MAEARPSGARPGPGPRSLLRPALLAALLALLWLVLSGGAPSSWIVGGPAIAAAVLVSRRLRQDDGLWQVDARGALRFIAYFVRESVRGGVDVVGRVCGRRVRVAPGMVVHAWRLPPQGPSRALFACSVSLLPGTLVAAMGEREALIHTLDVEADVAKDLAELEQRVAALFALQLSAASAAEDRHG